MGDRLGWAIFLLVFFAADFIVTLSFAENNTSCQSDCLRKVCFYCVFVQMLEFDHLQLSYVAVCSLTLSLSVTVPSASFG